MCPCGQGTEGGVGVTRPALWPSCQAVCILELTRAEGGAPGPVRLITGGQRPWGGPGSNGSPDWGHGLHHGEAVSCLLMPPRPASRGEAGAGAARRAGRAPRGPVPILSVELGWEQTESTAMLQALVTARLCRRLSQQGREVVASRLQHTAVMERPGPTLGCPLQGQSKRVAWIMLGATCHRAVTLSAV